VNNAPYNRHPSSCTVDHLPRHCRIEHSISKIPGFRCEITHVCDSVRENLKQEEMAKVMHDQLPKSHNSRICAREVLAKKARTYKGPSIGMSYGDVGWAKRWLQSGWPKNMAFKGRGSPNPIPLRFSLGFNRNYTALPHGQAVNMATSLLRPLYSGLSKTLVIFLLAGHFLKMASL